MLEEYPRLHRQWLSEGRVLVHCSMSGGLGDYLKSITSMVVLSMLTELALVLQCDVPVYDHWNKQRSNALPVHLARLFQGAHFDWTRRVALNSSALVVKQFVVMKTYARSASSMRVFSNAFAYSRRLIKYNARALASRLGAYGTAPNAYDLDSCFLRYLLRPRPALTAMLDRALGRRATRSGQRLVSAAATHVRMGDAVFKNDEWARSKWKTGKELRLNTFAQSPSWALRCLMAASEVAGASGPHGCMPCVVVSDSAWVEQCARAVLDEPVITPGVAAHLLASGTSVITQQENVDKIFLDWWLIARSSMSVDLGRGQSAKQSTFFWTAVDFKRVSSAAGVVLRVDASRLATRGELERCRTYRDTAYSYGLGRRPSAGRGPVAASAAATRTPAATPQRPKG